MVQLVKRDWGSEECLINNELYCCKYLNLKKDYRCSIHYHIDKDETFYILKGEVLLELFGTSKIMKKGDVYRITPYTLHRFIGIKDSVILEVSTHHDDNDSYRILVGGKIPLGGP